MPKAREVESMRGGLLLLSLGGLRGSPPRFFVLVLSASMCVLMCFMRLGTDFSHDFLLENIFLDE